MTPGPWERIGLGMRDGKWWSQIVSQGRGVVMLGDDASVEAAANARAIACLPELVEAARAYIEAVPDWASFNLKGGNAQFQRLHDNLRRILARVEGERE